MHKTILFTLAISVLLGACGGGGSSGDQNVEGKYADALKSDSIRAQKALQEELNLNPIPGTMNLTGIWVSTWVSVGEFTDNTTSPSVRGDVADEGFDVLVITDNGPNLTVNYCEEPEPENSWTLEYVTSDTLRYGDDLNNDYVANIDDRNRITFPVIKNNYGNASFSEELYYREVLIKISDVTPSVIGYVDENTLPSVDVTCAYYGNFSYVYPGETLNQAYFYYETSSVSEHIEQDEFTSIARDTNEVIVTEPTKTLRFGF